jgi:hypothetical protein
MKLTRYLDFGKVAAQPPTEARFREYRRFVSNLQLTDATGDTKQSHLGRCG